MRPIRFVRNDHPEMGEQLGFKAEDEIIEKRDSLIESLEKRLSQRTHRETLFTIRWSVV